MITRISKKKVFFRNMLAKLGLAKPLYVYNFSDSCPNEIITDFSEDGMIGRMDARDIIFAALQAASIKHIYYSSDSIFTNLKTVERHLKMYPGSEYGLRIKNSSGWQKFLWKISSGTLLGFEYFLYFETLEEMTAFRIVR